MSLRKQRTPQMTELRSLWVDHRCRELPNENPCSEVVKEICAEFHRAIAAHDAEMRGKWEEERRTFKELEIVNDHLIARGVYPEEYPAGEAYGALPYSDAEHLVNLREVSGYRTEEQIRAALAEELRGELPVQLAETAGSDTGWLYDMSDWGPCPSEGNEHVDFRDENGFNIGSIDLHLIARIAAQIAEGADHA